MQLIKIKNKHVVADNIFFAKTIKQRSQGMMGKNPPEAIYFQTRFGIHTFGVKIPIDVLVCDDQMIVRKIILNIKSNKFIFWNPKWKNIFEFQSNLNALQNISVADELKIIHVAN